AAWRRLRARATAILARLSGRRGSASPASTARREPDTVRQGVGKRVVVRVPKLRLRFPNLIDRYVLARFGTIFALVMVSALALRVVADFTENVDDILRNQPAGSVIFRYYRYQMLQMAF